MTICLFTLFFPQVLLGFTLWQKRVSKKVDGRTLTKAKYQIIDYTAHEGACIGAEIQSDGAKGFF